MSNPELLILSQPTWGIDAGSEAFIKKTIVELSQKGVSIIIISHDLDELLEYVTKYRFYMRVFIKSLKCRGYKYHQIRQVYGWSFD